MLGFVAVMLLNSSFTLHPQARRLILEFDQFLFLMVMIALGLTTRLARLREGGVGWRLLGVGAIGLVLSSASPTGWSPRRRRRPAPRRARPRARCSPRPAAGLFSSIGCDKCHVPSLRARDGGAVTLFSDLLIHDMGAALDDKIARATPPVPTGAPRRSSPCTRASATCTTAGRRRCAMRCSRTAARRRSCAIASSGSTTPTRTPSIDSWAGSDDALKPRPFATSRRRARATARSSAIERDRARADSTMSSSPDRTIELLALALFVVALIHTFAARQFERLSHRYPRHAGLFHLLGEVEVVFGFWAMVLVVAMAVVGGGAAVGYAESRNYTEPLFVFVVMVVAASGRCCARCWRAIDAHRAVSCRCRRRSRAPGSAWPRSRCSAR